jgi:hypothetical protein
VLSRLKKCLQNKNFSQNVSKKFNFKPENDVPVGNLEEQNIIFFLHLYSHLRKELDPELDPDPTKMSRIPNTLVRHVTGNDQDYLRKIPRVVVQKSALL